MKSPLFSLKIFNVFFPHAVKSLAVSTISTTEGSPIHMLPVRQLAMISCFSCGGDQPSQQIYKVEPFLYFVCLWIDLRPRPQSFVMVHRLRRKREKEMVEKDSTVVQLGILFVDFTNKKVAQLQLFLYNNMGRCYSRLTHTLDYTTFWKKSKKGSQVESICSDIFFRKPHLRQIIFYFYSNFRLT